MITRIAKIRGLRAYKRVIVKDGKVHCDKEITTLDGCRGCSRLSAILYSGSEHTVFCYRRKPGKEVWS